ncbi:MAG: M23 family metallopeptidase [Dehalococcoidia bacterium]|nr:M23 family metallopeptidase [Dehalococcoidia bacterium]
MGLLYIDPATGWELPVAGGVVTQGYGPENTDPSVRHLYRKGYHTGIDIGGVALDAPVVSPRDATVVSADVNGGYGNCVVLECEDGAQALFGHLNTISVAAGQSVFVGDQLGGAGTTGVSTGVHLHYEWRRGGDDIDPVPFMLASAPAQSWTAVVKEALNLRSGPSKNDPILTTLEAGSTVHIGAEGWVPVWYEGRQGWMFAEYLELQASDTGGRSRRRGG